MRFISIEICCHYMGFSLNNTSQKFLKQFEVSYLDSTFNPESEEKFANYSFEHH